MIGVITTIEGNRIHTEPRQKYKGTPLSQQSAHPLKVHLRLPAVYMRVEVDLCLTYQRRDHVRSEFVKRLSTKLCFKSSVGFIDQCFFCIKNEVEEKERICVRWFSMPYHIPMQGVKFNHAIRGFCLDPAWGRVLKAGWSLEPPVVIVAWQSMLQQAQHVYSRLWSV